MLGLSHCTDCGLKYANQHRDGDPVCQDCATDRDQARARKPNPTPCLTCRDETGRQRIWNHTVTPRPLGCEDPNCHSGWLVPKIKAAPGFDPTDFDWCNRALGYTKK
jgi:hypothetical protein